jgi:transcription initiation factor TFIIE subunit alpha
LAYSEDEIIKVAPFFGGEEAVNVVRALMKLGDSTDESIAAETGIRINVVRKILYKLYDHALVASTRVRNENTGWYTFYWKLQLDQLDAFIRSRKRRTLKKLAARLEYERSHTFFTCENCPEVRITFEEAMETAFRCPKCDSPLKNVDNTRIVERLAELVKKLEEELSE